MTTTYAVYIDFDDDGSFATSGDNISTYVVDIPIIQLGMATHRDRVAAGGRATIIVNNEDRRFSPLNTGSPYYGKLAPGRAVSIQATEGATTWTLFSGVIDSITPSPGELGGKRAIIQCIDRISQLQRVYISLPIQTDKTADYLLKLIGSEAYKTGVATGYVEFSDQPADGDSVTVDDKTFTFKTTLTPTAGEVLIGSTLADTIENLVAAINGEGTSGTQYAAGTFRCTNITAASDGEYLSIPTAGVAQGFAVGRFGNGNMYYAGQSFTIETGGRIGDLEVWFGVRGGTPTGRVISRLYTYDAENTSPDTWIGETAITPAASEPAWNTFPFSLLSDYLEPGQYCFTFEPEDAQTTGNYFVVLASDGNAGDVYADGTFLQLQADPPASWGTWPGQDLTMRFTLDPCRVFLTANARGAWGNSIALSVSGANLSASGATLAGGADGPAGAIDYEEGRRTFGLSADLWDREYTTAMRAIIDVVDSERGYFWAARDGTLIFKNTSWEFRQFNTTSSLTINETSRFMDGAMRLADVYNRISVRYTPRALLDEGIVASSSTDIRVPPGKGSFRRARRNPTEALRGEATTVQLRFTDPSTGKPMGAKDLILPLEPGVDYHVFNPANQDITSLNFVDVTTSVTATGVDLTATSIRNNTLVLRGVQVRGTGIVTYDPITITIDDEDSQAAYGRQSVTIVMPLEANDAANFAESLAGYLLGQWKDPAYQITRLGFDDTSVDGTNILSIDIGDIVSVTESETALDGQKMVVLGMLYAIRDNQLSAEFLVSRVDKKTYWILEDSTYGVLGSTTRLAI